jgi:DNA-binding MarR family transcriptional regulator
MNKKNLPVSLNIVLNLKAIEHAFKKNIYGLNINLPSDAFGILMIAYFQDDVIQQNIADMTKKDKSAVLKQIDVLESKGLVQRQVDVQDRRKKTIVITDEGKQVIIKLIDKEREMFNILTQGIEKCEMEDFLKVLSLLKVNAGKIG